METNLQSNEVRIPKSPQSPAACPQFKSTFARSLSFNTTNNQPVKPLDFEINFRIAQNIDHLTSSHNGTTSMMMTATTAAAASAATTTPTTNSLNTVTPPQSHKIEDIDEDFEEFMRNSPLKQTLQHFAAQSATAPTTATTTTTPTSATPTRKNVAASRVYNATCSGRHRFQVNIQPIHQTI